MTKPSHSPCRSATLTVRQACGCGCVMPSYRTCRRFRIIILHFFLFFVPPSFSDSAAEPSQLALPCVVTCRPDFCHHHHSSSRPWPPDRSSMDISFTTRLVHPVKCCV